jgi:primary-amine oxidase
VGRADALGIGLGRGGPWLRSTGRQERHAAGDYPNQSGGDGLPRWTERDRPLADTDVVLWYTFGPTHLPRPEDYPVMPTGCRMHHSGRK